MSSNELFKTFRNFAYAYVYTIVLSSCHNKSSLHYWPAKSAVGMNWKKYVFLDKLQQRT